MLASVQKGRPRAAAGNDEPGSQAIDKEARLQIYLIGPSWIQWQDEAVTVCRRQARGLLYRLAAHPQPVPREELCFTFWSDTAEATAHRHLSHVLCHLRECLPIPNLLRAANELVELDSNRVWCDARAFHGGCEQPETQDAAALQQALELYRGRFLAGFSLPGKPEFEHWVARQRNAFERVYLDALAVLMTVEANRQDFAKAIRYGRQYLAVDELAEGVHRQLMVLYSMTGNRPAALQQYRDCASALERRLRVEPLPETRAVYQAILQS